MRRGGGVKEKNENSLLYVIYGFTSSCQYSDLDDDSSVTDNLGVCHQDVKQSVLMTQN